MENLGKSPNERKGTERKGGAGTQDTDVLAGLAQAISTLESPEELADFLADQLLAWQAKAVHVFLEDRATGDFRLFTHRGLPPALAAKLQHTGQIPGIAMQAAADQAVQIVPDVFEHTYANLDITREIAGFAGAPCIVAIPLIAFGRLCGTLTIFFAHAETAAPTEIARLQAIASIFTVAIINAHACRFEKSMRQRLSELREAGLAIAEPLDYDEFLQRLVHQARKIGRAEFAVVGILGSEVADRTFQDIAISGASPAAEAPAPPRPIGLANTVLATQRGIRLRTARQSTASELPDGFPVAKQSLLALPIVLKGHPAGVLILGDRQNAVEFSLDDQHEMELFAQEASFVLNHMREHASLRAENARRLQAESDLIKAQQLAHVGSWVWDVATPMLEFSDEALRILGLDTHMPAIKYEDFLRLVHPEDVEAVKQAVNKAFTQKAAYQIDYRIVRPDGTERTVAERAEVKLDEAGQLDCLIGTLHDITRRKAAENVLRQWEEMFNTAAWGVVLSDGKQLTNVNPAFAAMHGFSVKEMPGMPVLDLFPPELHAQVRSQLRHADEVGHYTFESLHRKKDGASFPVLIDVTSVKNHQGRVMNRVVYVQDITESKKCRQSVSIYLPSWMRSVGDCRR